MFHSTRGNELLNSFDAIIKGLASDGGLFVIDKLKSIDYKELLNDDYKTLATKIIKLFFDEFEYDEIYNEINLAYSKFDTKNVVELKKCDNNYFLELFHGPTLAFKDLALQVLPRLMRLSKEKLGIKKNITILTATSGDTGGAALDGFMNVDGISIVVLYPNNGVSKVQEAQMTSYRGNNRVVLAINGNFDDCQSFVKQYFNKHTELNLSSANSINIARLVPQIVYYFYSYITLVNNKNIKLDEKINFVVPTGNFGNILAGYFAKAMGLPISNLICASNKNNVLTDFFNKNEYNKNRQFYKTNSPSMDILISSNLERFIYYASGEDINLVNKLMNELKNNGKYDFKNPYDYFYAYSVNENETLKIIKEVYDKYNYLIDPHTAVAYGAYLSYKNETKDSSSTVIVSTASPFKFPESVLKAFDVEINDSLKAIDELSKKFKLEIPKVLNYPTAKREIVDLDKADKYITDVIKCF